MEGMFLSQVNIRPLVYPRKRPHSNALEATFTIFGGESDTRHGNLGLFPLTTC